MPMSKPTITYYKPDGSWGVKGMEWGHIPAELYGALHKLMEMEHSFERMIEPDGACACQFCEYRYDELSAFPCNTCPAFPKGRRI